MKNIIHYAYTLSFLLMLTACQQKDNDQSEVVKEVTKEVVTIKACTKEAKICPDGKSVSRNPNNNCEFDLCKSIKKIKNPVMCSTDVKECPDGSYVSRNHKYNCRFKDCPNSEK